MRERLTASTITDEQLDALYEERDRLSYEVQEWKSTYGEDALRDTLARLRTAESAVSRARRLASRWAVLRAYGGAATELRTALDDTQPQTAAEARQDEPWPVKESTRRYAEELRRARGQASADGHTGWECDAGASLLVSATTPGPGKLGTHHGTVYACATHQSAAVERITGAGYEADAQPAPPGHRWNPWPCGHVTAHDTQALTTLTATGAQQDGVQS